MWDEHFGGLGWSDAAEHFFTTRKQRIHDEYKPLTREEWRKMLRIGEKKASRFWSSVERLADEACVSKGL